MGWNEPGSKPGNGSGNQGDNGSGQSPNDPWTRKPEQSPPDLDELLGKLKERFGGGGKKSGGGGGAKSGGKGPSPFIFGLVAIVAIGAWLFSGFYIVDEQENGVVFQFGKQIAVKDPGLGWHIPAPIQKIEMVQVTKYREVKIRTSMLTEDENIVDISLKVFYRVSSPTKYLFSLRDPDSIVAEVTRSSIREVVGKSEMDFIITAGRGAIATQTQLLMQDTLQEVYDSGLIVTEVNLEAADPPNSVRGAFADAVKAREDQERTINEAETYANNVLPRARGAAAREVQQAEGYRERVVEESRGEASRFTALLTEYRKAPGVTRDRLYLDAMSDVLTSTSKVILDVEEGTSPLLYLPIDKIAEGAGRRRSEGNVSQMQAGQSGPSGTSSRSSRAAESDPQSSRSRGRR